MSVPSQQAIESFRGIVDHVYNLQEAAPDLLGFIEAEDNLIRNFPSSLGREGLVFLEASLTRDALKKVDSITQEGRMPSVAEINRKIRQGGLNFDGFSRDRMEELVRTNKNEAESNPDVKDELDFAAEEGAIWKKGKGKRRWWEWILIIIIIIIDIFF